jgi:hypothetical protein
LHIDSGEPEKVVLLRRDKQFNNSHVLKIKEIFFSNFQEGQSVTRNLLPSIESLGEIIGLNNPGQFLFKTQKGCWVISHLPPTEAEHCEPYGPYNYPEPDYPYNFVVFPFNISASSCILVIRAGKSAHIALAGKAPYVLYAGTVTFDLNGNISKWDNQSNTFIPPADLHHQAGFGPEAEDKFYPFSDGSVSHDPKSPLRSPNRHNFFSTKPILPRALFPEEFYCSKNKEICIDIHQDEEGQNQDKENQSEESINNLEMT